MFLSKTCEGVLNCSLACHQKHMWISSGKNCILCSECAKILVELIYLMSSILPLCCIFSCPMKSVKRDSSLFRYLQCKMYQSINYKGILVHLAVKLILLMSTVPSACPVLTEISLHSASLRLPLKQGSRKRSIYLYLLNHQVKCSAKQLFYHSLVMTLLLI